jgi:NADPH-dependent glutamate synthase beta subunit-like oxidoreductase
MTTVTENTKAAGKLSQIHGEKCWPMVDKVSPCEQACPLETDVPSYVIAIAQGKFEEALNVIRETNPLPSVCGYVCHQPCEAVCNRKVIDEPIAIRSLKRFAADYNALWGRKAEKVKAAKKEKVAVVGSGPAGLTAAYDLVHLGYKVTVYESSDKAGGWLTNGIPEFILPQKVAQADIEFIKDSGVDIRTGVTIGKDISISGLKDKGYSAVLLAGGAQKSAGLNIPGSDLKNILPALEVLKKASRKEGLALNGRVLVIGGGAVAMDAARTALRSGASEVHISCLESRLDMPAWPWEIEAAEKEGVLVHTSLAPQSFSRAGTSKKLAIEFKRVASTSTDKEGRISWELMQGPGSDYRMEADYIIVAIGQVTDTSYVKDSKVKVNRRGAIEADADTLQTAEPGVFASGDAVNVRGTVTESIAMGHKAALSIDSFLQGKKPKSSKKAAEKEVLEIDPKLTSPWLARKARWSMPVLSAQDAVRTFSEVNLGFTAEQAIEEARRCLNCRMCANCIYGRGQICYETAMRLLK